MEATHQHLTTIAEFMGWEIKITNTQLGHHLYFIDAQKKVQLPDSFDTMRMVFDKWRDECDDLADCDFRKYVELLKNIERSLCSGTPSDCAARLAEAIEWWKSVK